jgi:hypothetical protein
MSLSPLGNFQFAGLRLVGDLDPPLIDCEFCILLQALLKNKTSDTYTFREQVSDG